MERMKTNAQLIAAEVSKMFGDSGSDHGTDDIAGAEVW